MKKNKILLVCTALLILWFFAFNQPAIPIEGLDISIGAGGDIINKKEKIMFSLPISVYEFGGKDKVLSRVLKAYAKTLAETRMSRQLRANKKFIIGNEKVHIWSEDFAKYGLKNIIDILFENPFVNNTASIIICHGKSIDILRKKIPAYPSSADYIIGMITNGIDQNFLSHEYTLLDIFVRMDSEGKSIVLPYLSVKKNELTLDGMAIFNKDKMVARLPMTEGRVMSMLREKSSNGMLTLYSSPRNYINLQSAVNRKVKCNKINGKFTFTIYLDIKGFIVVNESYKDIYNKPSEIKKFTDKMSKHVEQISYSFIKKMQKKYKVDCLELGQFAAAKYGRHTGIDWNKAVSNSKIVVKAKVSIEKVTRGNY